MRVVLERLGRTVEKGRNQIHRAKWLRQTKNSMLVATTAVGLFAFAIFGGCAGYTAKTNGGGPGSLLWSADMETGGLSQWFFPMTGPVGNFGGDIENSGIANAVASTDFARSGAYSAKLTITTPDTPTSGARLFRWAEAQTYPQLYYSVWYYFPQSYTPSLFWNVLQWKSKHVVSGTVVSDPFFSLEVGALPNGEMYFYLGDDHLNTTFQQPAQSLMPVPVGRWFNVQAFYKCDGSGAGEVTIWQDGTQLWDIQNVDTRYADGDCAWSVNNYSSGLTPATSTIYIDDAAICSGGRCR
jgi:polysaccharide lyase-like protein